MCKRAQNQGFTLIELLVAVFIMAVMTVMAWRAMDSMHSTSTQSASYTNAVLTLDAGLAQWVTDLEQLQELPHTTALDWNGRTLRITRRHSSDPAQGLLVVAWTRNPRGTDLPAENTPHQWLRWQSAPVRTQQAWQSAWDIAAQWGENQNTPAQSREVVIAPLQDWKIYYFRGGAWSNALSSAGSADASQASTPADNSVPDGVRLVLTVAPPHPMAGVLTRDWSRTTTNTKATP